MLQDETVSKQHSLYQSNTNSEFFQSVAPDLDETKEFRFKQKTKLVDMGTDPMSSHKVSERQNFGSEYTANSQQ